MLRENSPPTPEIILVIFDSQADLHQLSNILNEQGYHVHSAADESNALNSIKANSPDLILLDANLPDSDAYELCQRLKQNDLSSEIPVIFINDSNKDFNISRAFAVGGVDYVSNPFQIEEVLARVKTHIHLHELKILQQKEISERKQTHKDHEQRALFFKSLFEAIPSPIFYKNNKGQYAECNQAFEQYIGRSRTEIIGKTVYDMGPPEIVDEYRQKDEELFQNPGVQRYEWKVNTASGDVRYVIFDKASLEDESGQVTGLVGTISDITDYKPIEAALQASEERYRALFENSNDAIFLHDLAGNIIDVNQKMLSLYGYSKADISTLNIIDLHPPEATKKSERAFETISQEGFVNFEAEFMKKNGEIFIADISSSLFEINGEPLVQSIVRDITERKKAEEALRGKTEELDRFFTVALDLLCIADVDGYFRRMNLQWEEVLGYSLSEMEGQRFIDLVHPDDKADTLAALAELSNQVTVLNFVNRYRCKDGSYRWIEWRSYPKGNLVYAAARDITERRQADEALRESEKRLSMIVQQMGAILWTTDNKLRFTSSQGAGLTSLNLKPEQIVGSTIFEYFQTDDEEFLPIVEHRRALQGESAAYNQTSGEYTFQTFLEPMRNEEGDIVGVIGISTDISESKKIQVALQESQQMLQTVLDTIPGRVFWKDRNLVYLGCNQPFADDGGLDSPQQIIGMDDFEMSWIEQAELYRADDFQVIQSGLPKLNFEEPQTNLDGERRWLRTSKIPLRDVDGSIIGVLGTYEDITDYKEAEEALQQANLVIENSPAVLFRWRAAEGWPVALVSQNVTQFGYTPEELLSGTVPFASLVHPNDLERVGSEVAEYTAKGIDRFKQEYRIVTKDGRIRWVDDRTLIERNKDGQVTFYQGIALDITERKQAEEELQHANWVIENSPVVLFRWQAAEGWPVVLVSQNVKQFGYTREELLSGMVPFYSMVHPEDKERVNTEVEAYTAKGIDRYKQDYRIITKDGQVRWVDDYTVIERDKDGEAAFYQGIVLDNTERKQAEVALRRAEWEKQTILDSLSDLVIYQDTNYKVLWVNRTACESVGAKREELIGRYCYEIWPKRNRPCTVCAVATARDAGQMAEKEVTTPDGRIWFNRGYPVQDIDGQVIGMIEVSQEITEQVRARREIRRLNEQLEQRVIERTAQLEAANQELEAFSYSVSHDLRAPLRAIDGYTRILVEDFGRKLDPEGHRVCGVIRSQTQRMGQLIDDLLTFSRLGRKQMKAASIDMTDMAIKSFNELTTPPERERIDFQISALPSAVGDQNLMRQVWQNLLANAVKFSSKQEQAVITVGFDQNERETTYYVRDNGAGFNMKYADKLFGVFQRLHSERDFEGTGVGLAIAQRIIHRHGGQIRAESQVGKGAVFYFSLPHGGSLE